MRQRVLVFIFSWGIWGLVASPHLHPAGEDLKFNIFFRDNKVGQVHAQKMPKDGGIHYEITSQVQVSLIKTFKIDFSLQNFYDNGKLDNALLKNSVNGNLRQQSTIKWQNNHYEVINLDETYKLEKAQALYSTACLYFEEPRERSRVFSENYLEYIPIKRQESGKYELQLPSGNSNLYIYDSNNKLEKAIIRDALVEFRFVRQ